MPMRWRRILESTAFASLRPQIRGPFSFWPLLQLLSTATVNNGGESAAFSTPHRRLASTQRQFNGAARMATRKGRQLHCSAALPHSEAQESAYGRIRATLYLSRKRSKKRGQRQFSTMNAGLVSAILSILSEAEARTGRHKKANRDRFIKRLFDMLPSQAKSRLASPEAMLKCARRHKANRGGRELLH